MIQCSVQISDSPGNRRGTKSLSKLASHHQLQPNQIRQWKRQLLEDGTPLFSRASADREKNQEALQIDLFEQIGCLKMELELHNKLPDSTVEKRTLEGRRIRSSSVRRQCELLAFPRYSFYPQPATESPK